MGRLLDKGIKMQELPSECPDGYSLSPDGTYCMKVTTTSATPGTMIYAQHFTNNYYTIDGLMFLKLDENNNPLYNTNGTWDLVNGKPDAYLTAHGNTYVLQASQNTNVITSSYDNILWCNMDTGSTQGRFNACGVWVQGNQRYTTEPVGFSREFVADVEGIYYIGIGSDDFGTVKLDNNTLISQDISAINGTYLSYLEDTLGKNLIWRLWWLIPVKLTKGPHIISITATNIGGPGALGCEVYFVAQDQGTPQCQSTSIETLASCTDYTQLSNYIVFSSASKGTFTNATIGVSDGEVLDSSYSCPAGYSLYEDAGSYYCRKLETSELI